MNQYFLNLDAAELLYLTHLLERDLVDSGNETSRVLLNKAKSQLKEFGQRQLNQSVNYQFFSLD